LSFRGVRSMRGRPVPRARALPCRRTASGAAR
jgi:hypothetical protein